MLKRLTERAWYLPWEEETDRPNLCYLLGERHSLAVDAGNSPAHVGKLYRALEEQGLPLPDFTVLTHWHWDHTFGLGAVHGVGIASAKTNQKLRQVAAWQWTPQAMEERERRGEDIPFCNEHIRKEYPRLGEIAVSPAAVELEGSLTLDLGGVRCQLLCQENPHAPDGLLVYVPQEGLVVLGDADCGDFYRLDGGYAPAPPGPWRGGSPLGTSSGRCRATAGRNPKRGSWRTWQPRRVLGGLYKRRALRRKLSGVFVKFSTREKTPWTGPERCVILRPGIF